MVMMQVNGGGYNLVNYKIARGNFNVTERVKVAESYPVIKFIENSINKDGKVTVKFESTNGQIIELILGDKQISYDSNETFLKSIQEAEKVNTAQRTMHDPGTGEPLTGGGRKKSKRKKSKKKRSKKKRSKKKRSKRKSKKR